MQLRRRMRLAACLAPPLAVFVAVGIIACRDALSSGKDQQGSNDALVTRPTSVSEAAIRARTRLHERNPHDWVGKAHNRALDDLRKELRKPGVLTRNLCGFISDFSTRPEVIPPEKRAVISKSDQQAIRGAIANGLCGGRTAFGRQELEAHFAANTSLKFNGVSLPANQLLLEIGTAVDAATSSYDLASRLHPILDAAAGLDTADQAAVSVTVSVAQSSFEYWESQLPSFQQEVAAEYGPCATEYQNQGYSRDEARSVCLEGRSLSETPSPFIPSPFRGSVVAKFASISAGECYTAWDGIVKTARSDKDGAIAGFFGALYATRTLRGAVVGAVVGAAAGSTRQAFQVTWDLYWCAYY